MGTPTVTKDSLIESWKKKYGKIFLIETTDAEGRNLEFVFKKPDMGTMGAVMKFAESDPLKSTQLLFKNCLVNKENASYADDVEVMMSVAPHLDKLIQQRTATIKEL